MIDIARPTKSGKADRTSQLVIQTRTLSETPDVAMLKRLRILERKMGLVLTLVRVALDAYLSSFDALGTRSSRHPCGVS